MFCKHKYKLFNVSEYHPFTINTFAEYEFVCKHCGKTKNIKSLHLQDELMQERAHQAKRKAMGLVHYIDNPEISRNLSVKVGTSAVIKEFSGDFVSAVKKKYIRKGIDLNEINKKYEWGQHLLIEEE